MESSCIAIGKSDQEYDSIERGRCITMASIPQDEGWDAIVPKRGISAEEDDVSSIV